MNKREKKIKQVRSNKEKRRMALVVTTSVLLILVIFVSGCAFSWFGIFSRIMQDMFKMGLDYIDLDHPLEKIDPDEIRTAIDTANGSLSHPFVLVTEEEFERTKTEYYAEDGDEYIKNRLDYSIAQADILIDTGFVDYTKNDRGEMLEPCRQALNRVTTLAGMWQITGNEDYAERCYAEIEYACNMEDWHPAHFLDTIEMTMAVTLCYDWLYDYLTEEQRDFLADNVYEKAIKPGNPNKLIKNWWSWSKVNWNTQCYGSLGIACMVFSDYFPDYAAKFLSKAYYNMPLHLESFSPDGVYVEGAGYWEAMGLYLLYFISTSRNYFGTDNGLSDLPGFDKIGYFPLYISTPLGVFNSGDNRNEFLFSPAIHWFAREYNEPMLSYYQKFSIKEAEYTSESVLSCLWYDPEMTSESADMDLPLSVYMSSDFGEEFVTMRSAYANPYATYAGIKSGYNYTNHGDLDIGSFIFYALGEEWVFDLGKASYALPGYFNGYIGGGRWRTYMKRAEGHNTLVINPDMASEDQYPYAFVKFDSFAPVVGGGTAILNMTDAYIRNGVETVTREFQMYGDYENLKITDHVVCKKESDIWWFAHTRADIEISSDGKTATLTLVNALTLETNQVIVKIAEGSAGTFEEMDTLPLLNDKRYEDNQAIEGVHKLAIHLENVTEADIIVTFEPVYID